MREKIVPTVSTKKTTQTQEKRTQPSKALVLEASLLVMCSNVATQSVSSLAKACQRGGVVWIMFGQNPKTRTAIHVLNQIIKDFWVNNLETYGR